MGEPRSWEHLQQPEEHLRQRSSGSSGEEGGLGDAEARPGGGGHGQGLHRRTGPCREDGGDGVPPFGTRFRKCSQLRVLRRGLRPDGRAPCRFCRRDPEADDGQEGRGPLEGFRGSDPENLHGDRGRKAEGRGREGQAELKVLFFSDAHGSEPALKLASRILDEFDVVIVGGDLTGPGSPDYPSRLLKSISRGGRSAYYVPGNADSLSIDRKSTRLNSSH